MRGASRDSTLVEVRTKGFSRRDWGVQKAILIAGPIDFLVIVFGTLGGPGSHTAVKVGVALGIIVFADLLCLEVAAFPRRVVMDPNGVTFRFRLHSTRRSWTELWPSLTPLVAWKDGSWAVFYTSRSRLAGGRRFGFDLTSEQARGLLRYPSGKAWSITPEMATLIQGSAS